MLIPPRNNSVSNVLFSQAEGKCTFLIQKTVKRCWVCLLNLKLVSRKRSMQELDWIG